MKFLRYSAFTAFLILAAASCKKDDANRWAVEIKNPVKSVNITDISGEFYDSAVSLDAFKQKYPWFQGTVSDEDYQIRRTDAQEIKIYKEAASKIDLAKLNKDLSALFSHIRNYFPQFPVPKVYLYSSALQSLEDPIFYQPQENLLFIDISAFMGNGNANYKGYLQYMQASMNPENIVPKVSQIFAMKIVPPGRDHQKFIDHIIYQGKLMMLQDAFLPGTPDHLKMNYTDEQWQWATQNEANIWNYFVENNLVFSDDARLGERFIQQGPFSKFYTEIDNESSPQIGIFTGWQICRSFLREHPDTKLQDFLKMNTTEIFNASGYKPKN